MGWWRSSPLDRTPVGHNGPHTPLGTIRRKPLQCHVKEPDQKGFLPLPQGHRTQHGYGTTAQQQPHLSTVLRKPLHYVLSGNKQLKHGAAHTDTAALICCWESLWSFRGTSNPPCPQVRQCSLDVPPDHSHWQIRAWLTPTLHISISIYQLQGCST